MQRSNEDNTIGIIQRAVNHYGIRVIKSTVKEALKSHPEYPTFKSICDTLNEWNIENYPVRYDVNELESLQTPFIVHFNHGGGRIGFVTGIWNDHVTYYTSYYEKRKIEKKDFIKITSGAVILIYPDERSGEKDYSINLKNELINKTLFPLALLAVLIFIIDSVNKNFILDGGDYNKVIPTLLITKIIGLVLSILLILHDFDMGHSLTNRLCHLNKATNCNTVLHDKASKVFGWFGWADIGFVYFLSGLLFLLQYPVNSGLFLLGALATLSIPYPLFSVYYQGFVLKKWCPWCLGVQLILIIEFVLLLPQFTYHTFSLTALANLTLTLLMIIIVYTAYVLFQRERISNQMNFYKYIEFKKNPQILKLLLSSEAHYDIKFSENSLIFGNRNASIKITAFLSLHCSYCVRAFNKIRDILSKKEDVLIILVLITTDKKMLSALYKSNIEGKNADSLKLLQQWFNTDSYSRNLLTEDLCIVEDIDLSGKINEENLRLYKECNVTGTPTFFVNGYKIPNHYELDDIRYFKEVFKE